MPLQTMVPARGGASCALQARVTQPSRTPATRCACGPGTPAMVRSPLAGGPEAAARQQRQRRPCGAPAAAHRHARSARPAPAGARLPVGKQRWSARCRRMPASQADARGRTARPPEEPAIDAGPLPPAQCQVVEPDVVTSPAIALGNTVVARCIQQPMRHKTTIDDQPVERRRRSNAPAAALCARRRGRQAGTTTAAPPARPPSRNSRGAQLSDLMFAHDRHSNSDRHWSRRSPIRSRQSARARGSSYLGGWRAIDHATGNRPW
jgi:hypothetical protein